MMLIFNLFCDLFGVEQAGALGPMAASRCEKGGMKQYLQHIENFQMWCLKVHRLDGSGLDQYHE